MMRVPVWQPMDYNMGAVLKSHKCLACRDILADHEANRYSICQACWEIVAPAVVAEINKGD